MSLAQELLLENACVNFRDISYVRRDLLKQNMVFRSSQIFNDDESFSKILDLRKQGAETPGRINIPLIDQRTGLAILRDLTCMQKMKLLLLSPCLGFEKQLIQIIMRDEHSMLKFYIQIVENAIAPLREIFDLLSLSSSYPVLIHCVGGKDRTGIVIALLLRVLGCPRMDIVRDYAISEYHLGSALGGETNNILLTENSIKSPARVMHQLLQYLERTYGSVQNYLERHVGIPEATVESIVEILTR